MKQHIAVFTLGLSLLTSCMTDSALPLAWWRIGALVGVRFIILLLVDAPS